MKLIVFILILTYQSYSQSGSWTLLDPPISPSNRSQMSIISLNDDIVFLYGGYVPGLLNDTWIWNKNSSSWTQLNPPTNPGVLRLYGASKIDDNEILIVGGSTSAGGAGFTDRTWIWNNSSGSWTQKNPISKPSAARGPNVAMINNTEILYFGGEVSPGSYGNETWIWNNTSEEWIQKNPPNSPSPRCCSGIVSIGDNKVLMFGGIGNLNDTWEWDNNSGSWTELFPPNSPSGRHSARFSKLDDDEYLLFGGNAGAYNDETWIWNNSSRNWSQSIEIQMPSVRSHYGMANIRNNYILLFGGQDPSTLGETWTYGYELIGNQEEVVLVYDGPNNGDGNNDGILDSLQSNVVSLIVKDEYVTIEVIGNCDSIYDAAEKTEFIENNFIFPFGQIKFKLPCSNANVKIYYHGISSLEGYTYRKLFPDNTYKQFQNVTFSTETIGGNQVAVATLTLTDGGPGDYDGVVNGVIYDPGGPAIPITANIPIWDWWYSLILIPIIILGYKNYS